jgi:acyl-CoA thioester hydrolase
VPAQHVIELVAGADDIDQLGHVNNVVYLRWVQDVAMAHSAAVGWDHAAYQALGLVWVVRAHEIIYRTPCFAGERVRVETWVDSFAAASSVRKTRIARGADVLADASTLWAMMEVATGRPRRVPTELRKAFPVHISNE